MFTCPWWWFYRSPVHFSLIWASICWWLVQLFSCWLPWRTNLCVFIANCPMYTTCSSKKETNYGTDTLNRHWLFCCRGCLARFAAAYVPIHHGAILAFLCRQLIYIRHGSRPSGQASCGG